MLPLFPFYLPWSDESKCHDLFHPHEVKVKVTQSCPTLYNPMDYTVHGILQARILEWVAFPFSRGSSQPRDWIQVSLILQVDSLPAKPPRKPFILINRLFNSFSLSAIRVVSSAYLRLLIFLLATLIPACASSNPDFAWCPLHLG